jgi:bifunctional oligoribonuclease and PAP phosphatase NrnA
MIKIKEFKRKFWEMVEEAERVVITGHKGPDDDSIASMLAVYWLVSEKFPKKNIRMICSAESVEEWSYFEGSEKIEFVGEVVESDLQGFNPPSARWPKGPAAMPAGRQAVAAPVRVEPLLIMLDGGSFDRFSKKPEDLKKMAGKTICIDHHKSTPDKFDLSHISPTFSSTAEGVYRLLVEKDQKVPKRLAEIFLLGILGDTGNFAYLNKDTVQVLEIVQKLISESEVNIQELQGKYQQYPKRVLEAIGEMVANTKFFNDVGDWPPFQVSFVDKNKFSDGEVSRASHLYMTHYFGSIKGYNWGISITPRSDSTCSLSFRSLPGVVNVRKLAEKFNGGGHDLASGGEIKIKKPEKALEMILKALQI